MRLTLHGAGGAVRCPDGPVRSLALSCVLSRVTSTKYRYFTSSTGRQPTVCSRFEGLLRLVSAQSSNSTGEGVGCGRPDLSPPSHLGAKAKTDASSFFAILRIGACFLTDVDLDDQVDENFIRMKGRYALKAATTRPSSRIPLFGPPPPPFRSHH